MRKENKNPNSGSNKEISDYILGKTLGEGTFSKVKLATHKTTNENVAIKILQKNKINDVADTQRVLREIHILKLMRHPNIVQLYDIVQTPKKLLLVMQFMENGQLFNYIVQNERIKEEEACKLFHQLIDAIEHIHKIGIVHRDLKPQNLLLDHRKNLKIVDFGLSNTYKKNERLRTPCGSQCYAAPQMLKGQPYQGLKVDIWSSGVILFAMLCGYLPFQQSDNFNKFYDKICNSNYTIHESVSQLARDLIRKILNVDHQHRYQIDEIRKHPWMTMTLKKSNSNNNLNIPRGIIFGYNRIPVDEKILESLGQLGLNTDEIQKTQNYLQANRHNSLTTTYYLALKKYIRNGGSSKCDLNGQNFDPSILNMLYKESSNTQNCFSNYQLQLNMKKSKKQQSNQIPVLIDSYEQIQSNKKSQANISFSNNTNRKQKSSQNSRAKQILKSKSKQNRKSKEKILVQKSHGQPTKDPLRHKHSSKQNISGNANINSNMSLSTDLQGNQPSKPRRQRVNSRPSKIDSAIQNSINYGRASVNNVQGNPGPKSMDKNIIVNQNRQSGFQNRLNRRYKQKFNQSLVSKSRDRARTVINHSANMISHNNSHSFGNMNVNSNRTKAESSKNKSIHTQLKKNITDGISSQIDKENICSINGNEADCKSSENKGRNRRILSNKNNKKNNICSIKSDINKLIPKSRWV